MKTTINLEDTVFDFKGFLRGGGQVPMIPGWDNKGKLHMLPDFGTIFIGLNRVTNPDALEELISATVGGGPVFEAPEEWSWARIARALGIFKSSTQARKNGWDGTPAEGFNFRRTRICKIKGEVLVIRITDESPWVTDFS